jgi:hypothetical protein
MKKFRSFLLFATVCSLFFSSCEEDIEKSDMTLDLSKKATVSAYVYAELDKTTAGYEYAPNGTEVFLTIPQSSFNPSASGTWQDTAVVNNGIIEAEVPVTNDRVSVTLTCAEFTQDQTQSYGSNSEVISKLFKADQTNVWIRTGEQKTVEIFYNADALSNHVEMVTVKYEAYANVDETQFNEYVPEGTEIHVFNDAFSTKVTVGADGTFEVEVPADKSFSMEFFAQKTLDTDPVSYKKYRYRQNWAPATSTPQVQQINFGNGDLWE